MYHVITATAAYASHILGLCISGTVHSVYKKTINIQLGQHLLALQSAASPLSPISLITDMEGRSMDQLPIRPGQPVNVLGDRIEIVMPDSASAGCSSSFYISRKRSTNRDWPLCPQAFPTRDFARGCIASCPPRTSEAFACCPTPIRVRQNLLISSLKLPGSGCRPACSFLRRDSMRTLPAH